MALLVIAAIMTGIAFGIMALIGALKDPCQSGYHYDNNLKVCVKDGCKNICKADTGEHKPGNCLTDDYCDYSDTGIKYQFDPDSCECIGICSNNNQIAKTYNGDDSTKMKKTNSGWEPINKLSCGYKCKFNKAGICNNKDSYCGISIDNNGKIISISTNDNISCIKLNNNIKKCSSDENIICDSKTFKCSSTTEDIYVSDYKYKTNTYCSRITTCGNSDPEQEIICRKGTTDCGNGNGNCKTYDLFSQKGIYQLGICDNKNNFFDDDEKCNNPKYIGENKLSRSGSKTSSWKEVAYKTDSGYEGISLNQPQCNAVSSPQCLKRDSNAPWFCLSGDLTSCNHGKPPATLCEYNPPLSSSSEEEGYWNSPKYTPNCCDNKKLSTLGDGSFCCPLNIVKSGNKYLCLNTSEYPPDSSWVSLEETTCSTNEQCQENRQILYDKLKVGITDSKDYPQNSNIEDPTYADLYCDNKKCKFFAGYVDKVTKNSKLNYEAKWMVGDNDITSTSEAIYINPNKKSWKPIEFNYNKGKKLNFCETDSDTNGRFGIYNSDGSPIEDTEPTTNRYKSKVHVAKNSTINITNLECLNYAK